MAREAKERAIRCMASTEGGAAVVMEGLLTKRSIGKTLVHNWKKRHFRLYYFGKLAYYVAEKDSADSETTDRYSRTTAKGSLVLTWDMQVGEGGWHPPPGLCSAATHGPPPRLTR